MSPVSLDNPPTYHATRPKISRDGSAVAFMYKTTSTSGFKPCCAIRSGTTWTDNLMLTQDGLGSVSQAILNPGWQSPGISNDDGAGNHWVCFRSLVNKLGGSGSYYPLVRWKAGSSTDGTTFNFGFTTDSDQPDLDATPNYVVFAHGGQIYRGPCWSGTTELVSAVSGAPCAGGCGSPSIDSNGTDITYSSTASDLPTHSNTQDVYWAEAQSGVWSSSLVSLGGLDATCALPSISSNATYISFESNGHLTVDHAVSWGSFLGIGAYLETTGAMSSLDLDSFHQTASPWRSARWGSSSVCDDSGECVFDSDATDITSSGDSTYVWDIFIFTP